MMQRDWTNVLAAAILVVLVALSVTGSVVHAELVYGDWTCAFAHCVKVTR